MATQVKKEATFPARAVISQHTYLGSQTSAGSRGSVNLSPLTSFTFKRQVSAAVNKPGRS